MFKVFVFVISFFIIYYVNAQDKNSHYQGGQGGDMPKTCTISGVVIDEANKLPVEYANIVLYSSKDSSVVSGIIADNKGNFKLEKLSFGRFYAEVSFIGYKKKILQNIALNPKQGTDIDLGKIFLEKNIEAIGEVEVIADKRLIEYKIDKKIINVSQDIISSGGTAVDVLENTPSIKTDIDGNVLLRGSSSFKVLVDGKPSIMESSEILQQIPASSIENIEIITNPSAKYDPEGVSGIINVVLKKQKESGFNGIVNIKLATFGNYGGDALFNYRTGKFNFFAGGGIDNNLRQGVGNSLRESNINDTTFFLSKDVDNFRGHNGANIKAGFDFNLNDFNSLSIGGEIRNGGFQRGANDNTHFYSLPSNIESYYITENKIDADNLSYAINSSYLYKFKQKKHELLYTGVYSYSNVKRTNTLLETYTDNNWNELSYNPENSKSEELGISYNTDIKLDYSKPFDEKAKLESGYQYRNYNNKKDYVNKRYDYDSDIWSEIDSLFNSMNYNRSIHAAYSTYSNEFKGFEFLIGIRGEYSNRIINQNITKEKFTNSRIDFFPSLHISKQISKVFQTQLSYSRRINQPREYFLDPFILYLDKYTVRKGNPNLIPEFSDSYELNLQAKFEKYLISIETYRRQTNNLIERVSSLNENNIMVYSFENINKDQSIGIEMMLNMDLKKWLTINTSANVFNYSISGTLYNTDISQSTNTWNLKVNSTFKIKSDTRIQLNANYDAPTIEPQQKEAASYMIGIAIKQDFFKRKISVTLNLRDIFNTWKYDSYTYGSNFTVHDETKSKYPMINLSISYKINNYKQKRERLNSEQFGGEME